MKFLELLHGTLLIIGVIITLVLMFVVPFIISAYIISKCCLDGYSDDIKPKLLYFGLAIAMILIEIFIVHKIYLKYN